MNCIVIPIYKKLNQITCNELASLNQAFKILYKYQIIFISSDYSKIFEYKVLAKKTLIKNVKFELFHESYFTNINGYSKLLMSIDFYRRFSEYHYMLIYQLDAFVFKDELENWCNKKFDYIGAPWFDGYSNPKSNKLIGVGNGGFSLRNIPKFIFILKEIEKIEKVLMFWTKYNLEKFMKITFILKIFRLRSIQPLDGLLIFLNSDIKEDGFWSEFIPSIFSNFNVAPISEAIQFSFEVLPSYLYDLNNKILPFGCHAWEKYEPEFWEKHIHVSK